MVNPEAFRARAREAQPVTLADLMQLHGSDSPAVLLLVISVLCVLPVYGVGTALSGAIAALGWHWWRTARASQGGGGRSAHRVGAGGDANTPGFRLPERLGRVCLDARWSQRCLHGFAWLYDHAGRQLRPRWSLLTHPGTGVWWSLWIGLMAFVIFLPLPFGNVLPSLSLVLLSLGWMFRDGIAMVASCVAGAGAIGFTIAFADLVLSVLSRAWLWLQTWI